VRLGSKASEPFSLDEGAKMSATVPTALLSSTYFDLNQVRADLFDFLKDDLGHAVLASEHNSFPIDPDANTIENCRRRVEREADVLILIIGGRYGQVDLTSEKSVTNLEYLAARAKGISIYAFIEKRILAHYDNWCKNPDNKFTDCIDNRKLFEFIKTIRDVHKVWMVPFERAQDIVSALRSQFAYQLKASLDHKRRLEEHPAQKQLDGLIGQAYRVALEQPKGWEYKLFSELLNVEITRLAKKRRDYENQFVLGSGHRVNAQTFAAWSADRFAELHKMGPLFTQVINVDFKEAIGPSGSPGDIGKIRDAVRHLGEIYEYAIDWIQDLRRANFSAELKEVQPAFSKFPTDFINKIELLAKELARVLEGADEKIMRGENVTFELHLDLKADGIDEFKEALELALRRVKRGS
jgi:hypothetical protein